MLKTFSSVMSLPSVVFPYTAEEISSGFARSTSSIHLYICNIISVMIHFHIAIYSCLWPLSICYLQQWECKSAQTEMVTVTYLQTADRLGATMHVYKTCHITSFTLHVFTSWLSYLELEWMVVKMPSQWPQFKTAFQHLMGISKETSGHSPVVFMAKN